MFIYIINISKNGLLFQRSSSSLTSCAAFFDDIDNLIVYVWWFYYVTDPCMRSLITDPSSDIRILRRWDRIRVRVAIPETCAEYVYDGTWTNTQYDLDQSRVSRENQKVDDNWRCFFCYGRLLKRIRIVVFTTQTQIRHRQRYTRCPEHVCSSGVDPDVFLLGTNSVRVMTFDPRIVLRICWYKCKHGITIDGSVSEKDTWVSQFLVRRLIFVIFHISKLNYSCFLVCKFAMKLLSTSLMTPNTIRWTSVSISYTLTSDLLTLKIQYLILEAVIRARPFLSVRVLTLGISSLTPLRWSDMSG